MNKEQCNNCGTYELRQDMTVVDHYGLICDMCMNDFERCDICNDLTLHSELTDTTGMVNGGIGSACQYCLDDNDIDGGIFE